MRIFCVAVVTSSVCVEGAFPNIKKLLDWNMQRRYLGSANSLMVARRWALMYVRALVVSRPLHVDA